jgi:hypothetical protein
MGQNEIKISQEFDRKTLGIKVRDNGIGSLPFQNNDDLSPNIISPLVGPMELATIHSQRQPSSSTSPAYGMRKMLVLKDSEISFNIQGTFSEP